MKWDPAFTVLSLAKSSGSILAASHVRRIGYMCVCVRRASLSFATNQTDLLISSNHPVTGPKAVPLS
jgi:hypothetical protein